MSAPATPPERPRRILYVEACEDGTVGGSHQALFDLVRLLDRRRYEPVVLFYESNRWVRPMRALGIDVIVFDAERRREKAPHLSRSLPGRIHSVLAAPMRRAALLRREAIDIVHLNNSPAEGFEDWLPACRMLDVRCVAHAVGAFRPPRLAVGRWATRHYDRVIAISRYVEDTLTSQGMPPELIVRIPPGVDLAEFRGRVHVAAGDVRASLGVTGDDVLALMVGNVRHWKGQDVVLEALVGLAPPVRSRLHVAFVGAVSPADTAYRASLEALAATHDLTRQVTFLGARDDIPDLMNAADLVLHASRLPEPFGIVLVEALALGKPVLATRFGGPTEVLTAECGRLYDPAVPAELTALLAELTEDAALRRRLGAAASARAPAFDVSLTNRAIEDVYASLPMSRGPSRAKAVRITRPIASQP